MAVNAELVVKTNDLGPKNNMQEQFDVSVVISTYNRCNLLPSVLESVLAQEDTGDARYEIIVVDNNSTDQTRQVVESFIARDPRKIRYIFEKKQGLAYARNTGIAQARAPIIAFTDDDVRVARDWIAMIKRAFAEHTEVSCVGGKVLPQWESEPPAWLTRDHWSPLATMDYGDAPFYVDRRKQLCLVGANLCVRREAFAQVGLFSSDLQRVKDSIGSLEDSEFLLRLWRAGSRGMYIPGIIVTAEVQADRLTKAYHRRWHKGHGYFYAVMRAEEVERSRARLFDVPVHLYRQALTDALAWLKYRLLGERDKAFLHETRLYFFAGFFGKRREDFLVSRPRSRVREIATFLRSLAVSKRRTSSPN